MAAEHEQLIAVLLETKNLLLLPKKDFAWSLWNNPAEANAEIDAHIEKIKNNDYTGLRSLELLFAPTGSIQEVSVSSGWGQLFLELSSRFDQALLSLQKTANRV